MCFCSPGVNADNLGVTRQDAQDELKRLNLNGSCCLSLGREVQTDFSDKLRLVDQCLELCAFSRVLVSQERV